MARLGLRVRFTYAFHTREVRFERDLGKGFERSFPETFAFRAERHDPAELYLQLEDLWSKPGLLAPRANRRESEEVMVRLAGAMPGYLERVLSRIETEGRLEGAALARVYEDVGLLAQIMARFISDKQLDEQTRLHMAALHLRRVILRAYRSLLALRVAPEYLESYLAGSVDPVDPNDDTSEVGLFYTLQGGDEEAVNRCVVHVAERAFYRWLEDVCLDVSNRAFETEESPFEDREHEVLAAICATPGGTIDRGRDLVPFLRRPRNKDALRVLKKLEAWFLRRYDVRHGAAVIHHAARLARGEDDADQRLSIHSTRNYLLAIGVLGLPILLGALGYRRFPGLFDALAALEVVAALAVAFWFFLYRFLVRRDLTFFHAAVPRVAAGIIVGYAPVFLIDEVWDLAERSGLQILVVIGLLGMTTLLYLYVEVKGRIPDPDEALRRAQSIFLLGILQAIGLGVVITSLLGPFMAARNWGSEQEGLTVELLRSQTEPALGQLPLIVGLDPFYVFPTAVVLFAFLSFFIGTFLQLLWEELPITEPM